MPNPAAAQISITSPQLIASTRSQNLGSWRPSSAERLAISTSPSPPLGGRGRYPAPEVWEGKVGDGPNYLRPAPLTLPSPPGRREERVKKLAPEGKFGGKTNRRF